jgi:cyclin B
VPPAIDDFLYICDYAYQRDQFLAMERELFRTIGFDLGRPISYRFMRRYARVSGYLA